MMALLPAILVVTGAMATAVVVLRACALKDPALKREAAGLEKQQRLWTNARSSAASFVAAVRRDERCWRIESHSLQAQERSELVWPLRGSSDAKSET